MSQDRRVRWTDRLLATSAILMCWSRRATLLDAFHAARQSVVAMYKSRKRPGQTHEGFFKALANSSPRLVELLKGRLQQRAMQCAGSRWNTGRWVGLAVDGSRVECPRTVANEEAFGCGGRDKTTPQQWVTMVYHVVSGLLWDYRRGPAGASERADLLAMLLGLPAQTLLLMDAGFTGFALLQAIVASGRHFIVRVGANVTLLKGLGYDAAEDGSTVWLWPKGQQGKQPPLNLRKVKFIHSGQKVCLLTSVLSRQVLSDAEIRKWYRLRWGIEVQYRGLKQTMEHRKLLGDSPEMARTELDWAIIGLWLLELMQVGSRRWRRSARYSLAQGLRVVRRAMWRTGRVPAGGLERQLRRAVQDSYHRRRPKKARNWPHKKRQEPCGYPRIRTATPQEIALVQGFHGQKLPA